MTVYHVVSPTDLDATLRCRSPSVPPMNIYEFNQFPPGGWIRNIAFVEWLTISQTNYLPLHSVLFCLRSILFPTLNFFLSMCLSDLCLLSECLVIACLYSPSYSVLYFFLTRYRTTAGQSFDSTITAQILHLGSSDCLWETKFYRSMNFWGIGVFSRFEDSRLHNSWI